MKDHKVQVHCCKTRFSWLVAWQPWKENIYTFKISRRRAVKETKSFTLLLPSVRFIITHVYILLDLTFTEHRWRCVQIVNIRTAKIHSSDLSRGLEETDLKWYLCERKEHWEQHVQTFTATFKPTRYIKTSRCLLSGQGHMFLNFIMKRGTTR